MRWSNYRWPDVENVQTPSVVTTASDGSLIEENEQRSAPYLPLSTGRSAAEMAATIYGPPCGWASLPVINSPFAHRHYFVDAVVTSTIRLRFDGHSTTYRRSLRSQWRNTDRWPASRCHVDLFIYLGRDVGRRNIRIAVEFQSNCSRIDVES